MDRRDLLRGIGLAALAGPALPRMARAQTIVGAAAAEGASARPWYDLGLMADEILNQVLLFYLGNAWQMETDIGECLDTASRVDGADEWSWAREWEKTAERVRRVAEGAEAAGHRVSAGEVHLRASSYYRAALHRHPDPFDPNVPHLARRVVEEFGKAIHLLPIAAEPVRIPYEGTTLPGYFFRAPKTHGKAPVLLVQQGRDAWAEDCKYLAEGAVKRGWHCLLFEGPGQGRVIRLQGLPFRPDWEKVVTPVVDFALRQRGVDEDRVALLGISMGGALAPRAAAFEKRLKILIANPGVYRWFDIIEDFIRALDPQLLTLLELDPAAFDAAIAQISAAVPLVRWGMTDTMWKHGVTTPSQLMFKMREFTNVGFAEQITCRTLVMDGTADTWAQGQLFLDALGGPKDYMLFDESSAAQLHVQTASISVGSQRMFDWLEDHL